jgi:hypothetical protein
MPNVCGLPTEPQSNLEHEAEILPSAPAGPITQLLTRVQQHDESLYGVRCVIAEAPHVMTNEEAAPETKQTCKQKLKETCIKVKKIVPRLPAYFAQETVGSLLPVLISSSCMLLCGLITQKFRDVIPSHIGTLKELEYRVGEMSYGHTLIPCVYRSIMVPSTCLYCGVMSCVPWRNAWRTYIFYGPPNAVVIVLLVFLSKFLMRRSENPGKTDRMMYVVIYFFVLTGFTTGITRTLQKCGQHYLGKMLGLLNIAVALNVFGYRVMMPRIMNSSDLFKVFLVCVINPVLFQVIVLAGARLIGRAYRNCDPSTAFLPVAAFLCVEKWSSCVVMTSIKNFYAIAAASLFSTVGSAIVTNIFGYEDVRLYRILGRVFGVDNPCSNMHFPTMGYVNTRNESFRVLVYVFNFTATLSMICSCTTYVIAYGVGEPDGTRIPVADTLKSFATQVVGAYISHTWLILLSEIKFKLDYFRLAQRRCKHFALISTCLCLPSPAMMAGSIIPYYLCGAPEGSEAAFVFCSE